MDYASGMSAKPAAYIRRSFVDAESPGDISEEAQLGAVRKLAKADGHNGDLVIYSDWGRSADVAKAAQRTEYARLLSDMEAGRISAVYAFDVDRLYRDVRDLIRLQDAAARHGVTVTTTAGRLPIGDTDDPAQEGFAFITAVFGRMELQKAKKRSRASLGARKTRGDKMGQAHYGYRLVREVPGDKNSRFIEVPDPERPASVVVDAYREAGSILGAARLLAERGVPAPRGGTRWSQSTVTRVLEHEAPGLLPRRGPTGRRSPSRMRFGQLLRCHCQHTLTPNAKRGQYYCARGHALGAAVHGRMAVREADILPWIRAEASRLHYGFDEAEMAAQNEERREAIREERRRLAIRYGRPGLMTDEEYQAEDDRLLAQLDALGEAVEAVAVERLDWTWPAEDINRGLRAMFRWIELDENMRPVRAEWRNPALRRP